MSERKPDDGVGTLLGTGLEESEDPLVDAMRALAELRAALERGDAEAVRPKLDLHAYGAGKRGLLSTLAAKKSVEDAVQQLGPFWQTADYEVLAARVISHDEVEIYETVSHRNVSQPLQTLTLLRRRGGHWRHVTTADTPDEKLVATLLCPHEPFLSDEPIPEARLERGTSEGRWRLVHPAHDWRAALRMGPTPESKIESDDPELAPALARSKHMVSVALSVSTDAEVRLAQLSWFANAVGGFGWALDADRVYIPLCDHLQHRRAFEVGDDATVLDLAKRYVVVRAADGWTGTRGMSHFMQPEIEARGMDWKDEAAATRVVEAAAEALLAGEIELRVRDEIEVRGLRCWVDYGRRGRREGETYGRWGSVRLAPPR